ncbi:hypothetical protein RHMOL_Rhmol09G0173500 [Rhododendron molle]|uniref:Uncharacterized protein n=1 Tax=Rhododendron molle TaxID=49168 RepID=A0ACC0MEP4_RHOML|nr:hypothetical protein RHMOL_Rhmol09G0173500 [Rhododendron molle]
MTIAHPHIVYCFGRSYEMRSWKKRCTVYIEQHRKTTLYNVRDPAMYASKSRFEQVESPKFKFNVIWLKLPSFFTSSREIWRRSFQKDHGSLRQPLQTLKNSPEFITSASPYPILNYLFRLSRRVRSTDPQKNPNKHHQTTEQGNHHKQKAQRRHPYVDRANRPNAKKEERTERERKREEYLGSGRALGWPWPWLWAGLAGGGFLVEGMRGGRWRRWQVLSAAAAVAAVSDG